MEVIDTTSNANSVTATLVEELCLRFENEVMAVQSYCDGIPVLWLKRDGLIIVLQYLSQSASIRFQMLFDITAIDERVRVNRQGQPGSDFTVTYHLMSFTHNCDIRLKVALLDADLVMPTISNLWPNANW